MLREARFAGMQADCLSLLLSHAQTQAALLLFNGMCD